MSHENPEETESEDDHLVGIEDGAGCTEIWEYLSGNRGDGEETGNTEADDG